jgi:hypothetical protein
VSEITLHNYEAFLLDYMERNLSEEGAAALKTFAILHPELNIQLDEEPVFLEKEHNTFEIKSNVKALHTDELAIGYVENILSGTELQKAENLLKTNLPFQHDVALYQKTIAQSDTFVVFENKQTLKREPKIFILTQAFWMRSAAAITLLAGLWFVICNIKENTELNKNLQAEVRTTNETKEAANTRPVSAENNTAQMNPENSKAAPQKTAAKSVLKTSRTEQDMAKTEDRPLNNGVTEENKPREKELLSVADTATSAPMKENAPVFVKTKYIIEEASDDEAAATRTKPVKQNKLMALASKAFKKLHQQGIEKVNGSQNDDALVIGAFSVSKND